MIIINIIMWMSEFVRPFSFRSVLLAVVQYCMDVAIRSVCVDFC